MYFSNFPKIYYPFVIAGEETLLVVKDITLNVRVIKEVLSNVLLYDEYYMQEGDTPEIIAEKVYGDPNLHWTIMLVNDKYDYVNDFPKSDYALEQYVIEKYGSTSYVNVDNTVTFTFAMEHTRVTGESVDISVLTREGVEEVFTTNVNVISPTVLTIELSNYRYRGAKKYVLSNRDVHHNLFGRLHYKTADGTIAELPTGVDLADSLLTAVSNYDYEAELNEEKRKVKLISNQVIGTFIDNIQEAFKTNV